jgi:uncharacterized repeat protein (TIGR03806 family)
MTLAFRICCTLLTLSLLTSCGGGGGGGSSRTNTPNTNTPAEENTGTSEKLSCTNLEKPAGNYSIALEEAFSGLRFDTPITLEFMPESESQAYLASRSGAIFYIGDSTGEFSKTLAADLAPLYNGISWDESQQFGITALAISPSYPGRPYIYIAINVLNTDMQVVSKVLRMTINTSSHTIDTQSAITIIEQVQTSIFHHVGDLDFGDDGYLYIGFGDGGPAIQATQLENILGSILRIDVSESSETAPYSIPPDNPFVGVSNAREEIYIYGLRNPWRFSFDRTDASLWVSDDGLSSWEEINAVQAGNFYGWPLYEGRFTSSSCSPQADCAAFSADSQMPYYAYSHDEGVAIIGGYVYRGSQIPGLRGSYVFGDFSTLDLFTITESSGSLDKSTLLSPDNIQQNGRLNAFAEDGVGELYAIISGNQVSVHKIVQSDSENQQPVENSVPEFLVDSGCIDIDSPRTAPKNAEFFDYGVNAPLWSDGAEKFRWFILPDGKNITINQEGDFIFPIGSTLVKSFEIDKQLIETRLLVRHQTGWAGYSYEWEDSQSGATLLASGKRKQLNGQVNWTFPSAQACFQCHTDASNIVLGPQINQLHQFSDSPSDFERLDESYDPIYESEINLSTIVTLAGLSNSDRSVESRAKSYLHANCAHCHQPGGTEQVDMDLRFETPLENMNICNVSASTFLNDGASTKRIEPGNADNSVLLQRINSVGDIQMPPLSKSVVDQNAVDLIKIWIDSLSCSEVSAS